MSSPDAPSESERTWRGPIAYMAQNPIAANLLMVILLAGGLWTAYTMQKEVFPEYRRPARSRPIGPRDGSTRDLPRRIISVP